MLWHKIAESPSDLNVGSNGLAEVEVGGKMVCVSVSSENVMACAQKCPHAGGRMADGYVDAMGNIVCPLHRYKFSLKNGRNVTGEGYFLKIFPVEIRQDGVFLGLEENNWLSWLK